MESAVICVDNSESVDNMCLEEQLRVVEFICKAIFRSNTDNRVSVMVSSPEPQIQIHFSENIIKIIENFPVISSNGQMSIGWTLLNAFGYLCQSLDTKWRVILFVNSLVADNESVATEAVEALRNVCPELTVDIISFGANVKSNSSHLKSLIEIFQQNSASNLYEIESSEKEDIMIALKGRIAHNICDEDYGLIKMAINCGSIRLLKDLFTKNESINLNSDESKEPANVAKESNESLGVGVYGLSSQRNTTRNTESGQLFNERDQQILDKLSESYLKVLEMNAENESTGYSLEDSEILVEEVEKELQT